ncbi:MAG: C4-dicarboxylate transporter DctQ subunit [Verrucomicrobiales bacterium]|jgi:C4-dicarboxylate transporter DctQ subunit
MKRAERILANLLEGLLAAAFLVIFALVVIQVVLRYVFNSSIPGANEVIIILFVYTTAIGGAIAAGRSEHIALTFAIDKLSPPASKAMDVLGLALVALINAVMVWHSLHWIGITGDYLMPSTGLPRMIAQASIPIGCGLATVYCAVKAIILSRASS